MQEELEEIVQKINEFSKKYDCELELELETHEKKYVDAYTYRRIYKLNATTPRRVIANA